MMRIVRPLAVTAVLALGLTALSGCSTPVVSPVTVKIADIGGTTVKVALNQVVNLDTGSLSVTSYSGKVADTSVATFTKGHKDGGATFNPGLTPHKAGTTQVTLSNSDGGIQNVTFTLTVTQ